MSIRCFIAEPITDSDLYRNVETGETFSLSNPPIGALWRATWYEDDPGSCGPDGQAWCVQTPGGQWHIDGRASNCDSPCASCGQPFSLHENGTIKCAFQESHPHHCWVRHGIAPNFTVNKNGVTCKAGGGSISQRNYHGFLRNGELINA